MEKKKRNKNAINKVKIATIILVIILISMVGFCGVYVQEKNQMSNKVKDYNLSMALNGARVVKLGIKEENETNEEENTAEDDFGNEEKNEEVTKKEYTVENYKNSKEIIEKRLKTLGVQEYNTRLNETTGEIELEIPENDNTDDIVSMLYLSGEFEIIDTDTKEVLIDNNDIKSANVLYNNTSSGTAVYLEIAFNKDGKQKLEEITKTYVKVEETTETTENSTENVTENATENATEEENEEKTDSEESKEKTITMKINNEEIMSTSFEEPITTGVIDLSVGSASTDTTTLQGYVDQARQVSTVLDSGKLEVDYEIASNEYILSNILEDNAKYVVIVLAVIVLIAMVVLVAKYKLNGLLAGISYLGLTALYLLVLRYTNVIISIESIIAILTIMVINYVFNLMLLKNIKNKVNKATMETYKRFFGSLIPICIMIVAFCFIKWIPVNSFAMTAFWGIVTIAIYNAIVTSSLLKMKEDK